MKTTLLLTSCMSLFGSISASEIAYSQNNLPAQHKQIDRYPFIFNGDVLLGKLSVQGITPVTFRQQENVNSDRTSTVFRLPNQAEVGVRAGIGVGLKNDLNVSVQWTYLRSGDRFKKTFTIVNQDSLIVNTGVSNGFFVANSPVTVRMSTKYSMHWLDLLAQMSKWMLTSRLRFQPFGGLRYFYFKFWRSVSVNAANLVTVPRATTVDKINATGAFIGTDWKYLIQRWLHFYSTVYVGILSGLHSNKLDRVNTSDINVINQNRYRMSFDPFATVQFGIATQFKLWKDSLLSIRIFYELFTMSTKVLQSSNQFSLASSNQQAEALGATDSIAEDVRYVKSQVGGLGLTVIF